MKKSAGGGPFASEPRKAGQTLQLTVGEATTAASLVVEMVAV